MESLGSWIDIEEFEQLARLLLERERQQQRTSAEAGVGDQVPSGGSVAPLPAATVARPVQPAAIEPAPVKPADPAVAAAPVPVDDLATAPEPADRALVERVRAKLALLTEDARRAGLLPVTSADADRGGLAGPHEVLGAVEGVFQVPEGGLLARLQAFAQWAGDLVGSTVALIDQHGDALVARTGFEARQQAMAVAVRALNQTAALLHAEPEARGTRMAWLAPDDGAALAVVGADRDGKTVWAGWIEQRHPGDPAVMRRLREALQQAIDG